jgi:L-alanine-DL-glutamate epimerase-like enolase superfamily enzyme
VIDHVRVDRIEVVTVAGFESCDRVFVAARAAGRTGWYGPVAEAYGRAAEKLAPTVTGQPITDHSRLCGILRGACDPSDKASSWAVGAIDCAVWDLHGRLAGVPVAGLLAGCPASAVSAYASWLRLDLIDPGNMDAVAATAAHPWRFTKWGLHLDDPDAASVGATGLAAATGRSARHAGGPVALDALGSWTPRLVEAFAEHVDPSALMWLEDPLPRHNLEQYRVLTATGLPIAVGERLLVGEDAARLLDVVRPAAFTLDVVGCGGLTRAIDLVAVARSAGVPVYPHGRSLVPAVHLAAAFPDAVVAVEYQLQWEPVRRSLYAESWLPQFGRLGVPASLGLGATPRSR